MKNLKLLPLTAVLGLAFAGHAQAGLVTYTFGGTVAGMPSEFSSLFSSGDAGQYVVTFDTSAPDSCGNSNQYCSDNSGITYMSLSVGSVLLASSNQGSYYVGPGGYANSILQPYTTTGFNSPGLFGYTPYQVQGNLWSTINNIFSNGVLPTASFSLSTFDYYSSVVADFTKSVVCTEANAWTVYGCYEWNVGSTQQVWTSGQFNMQLDSLVVTEGAAQTSASAPEPSSLALLGLAILSLGGLRRHKAA